MKRSFSVEAIWDAEAGVYYAKTDIVGLAIEAATLDEFENLLSEFAADLIVANHVSVEDLASAPLRDLMPLIIWQRPVAVAAQFEMVVGFYKTVITLLKQEGYVQTQNAKGSHEKWVAPATSKTLIVPRNLMSRHTANAILKDAGIKDRI